MSALLAIFLLAAAGAASDTDAWNEGVAYYEAGDNTNALQVLRPLMLTREYGARAAEVVAKLEYEAGDLEAAAFASQIALRANPKGEKENRNFAIAAGGLSAWRENRHIEAVLAEAAGKDPGAMLASAVRECRQVLAEAGCYRTNEAAKAVALSDALSGRAEALADVWIPVRETVARSVTNEQDAATILLQLDEARKATLDGARELADMDGEAYSSLARAESDFTRFLKLVVLPPGAMAEDLAAQSNAWADVEAVNGRGWQQDALDFTRAFRAKFPAWARAYEQQAAADTNLVAFAAEDQAKISALATELEKLQLECAETELPPKQEEAMGIIREIMALLPKNGQGGAAAAGAGEPPPEPDDNSQEPPESPETPPEEPPEPPPASDADDPGDDPVEAVLKKAEERNDEHEADKKARMRKAPLPPNERDW